MSLVEAFMLGAAITVGVFVTLGSLVLLFLAWAVAAGIDNHPRSWRIAAGGYIFGWFTVSLAVVLYFGANP